MRELLDRREIVAASVATIAFLALSRGLSRAAIAAGDAVDGGARRVTIEIRGFVFLPGDPDAAGDPGLRPGDVVVWTNRDIVPHTATASDGSWDTGLIEAGASVEVVVTEGMTAAYFCAYHPRMTARLAFAGD